MTFRKNKRLFTPISGKLEVISKASNNRATGEVHTDSNEYSTDFICRQLDFGFMKLLDSKPGPLVKPRVGTVVRCNVNGGPLRKGMIGVCYELYQLGNHQGASFIFDTRFYDGFSQQEQEQMLLEIGHCRELENYSFSNVIKLERDFFSGVFDDVLQNHKYIKFYED